MGARECAATLSSVCTAAIATLVDWLLETQARFRRDLGTFAGMFAVHAAVDDRGCCMLTGPLGSADAVWDEFAQVIRWSSIAPADLTPRGGPTTSQAQAHTTLSHVTS